MLTHRASVMSCHVCVHAVQVITVGDLNIAAEPRDVHPTFNHAAIYTERVGGAMAPATRVGSAMAPATYIPLHWGSQ